MNQLTNPKKETVAELSCHMISLLLSHPVSSMNDLTLSTCLPTSIMLHVCGERCCNTFDVLSDIGFDP